MDGKLISFEGLDNSGKTTVAKALVSRMRSRSLPVELARERSTPLAPLLLRLTEFSPLAKVFLFAADRAILLDQVSPALEAGTHVIFDRYYHSAIAYRTAEGGVDPGYVRSVNDVFRRPDISILLDIDVETAMRRETQAKGPTPYSRDLLERVRSVYLKLAETDGLLLVDATRPLEVVIEDVMNQVLSRLGVQ